MLANQATLNRMLKELVAKNNKEVDDLDSLLTVEGLKRLKMLCYGNLDLKAKSDEEVDLLKSFMGKAKDVKRLYCYYLIFICR